MGRVNAAQRLRLVLALCLVNIILASVALSVGFVGLQTPPATAGGPTPGIAFVSPPPTEPEPTPAPSPEPGSTPGTPTPTSGPGAEPAPSNPTSSPTPTPTAELSPPVEPTPTPTVGPAQPAEPAATRTPVRVPPVAVAPPNAPAPTPTPVRATPEPAKSPVACPGKKADKVVHKGSKAGACRALKPDKPDKPPKTHTPKHQHDKAKAQSKHKAEHHPTRHDSHEATVDKAQRGQKSGRRLRIIRRSR